MLAESLLEGLNPEQRRAVECTEGPLLVLAGAGSGKTRVLTNRIAYLIGVCGIPLENLLAVTFTNKAAGEMRERVEKLLGPRSGDLWIGTFHSVCVRILRRDIGHLERSRGFVIYDDADSLGVVKDVLKRNNLDPKVHDPKRLRWRIDQWKNAGVLPAEAEKKAYDIDEELCARLYAGYQRRLVDANALDFGDILLQTVELFKRFPKVLEYYQRRWQYILVDEYQDTNRVQYELISLLARAHRNICVVGDPDQSIYGWRGADVRNILDFEKDYDEAEVIKLERNYRSTQPILSGASAVVANNFERKRKKLFTEREGGDPIQFYEALDDREEAQFVVRKMLVASRNDGSSFGRFAILYRTNAQSRSFEEELLKYDVPYKVVGGVRFYERAEIKDTIAYLRLLVNQQDDQALIRIVNKPSRGIGKTTLERVAALSAERGVPLLEGLRLHAEASGSGRTANAIRSFLGMQQELREVLAARSLDQVIDHVLERSGYRAALVKEATPEAEARLDNLQELMASAGDFHSANEGLIGEDSSEVELFLEQVALISDIDGWDERAECVSLMTVHSAKGLEFPVVFLVGLEEGIFPHASSSGDAEGLEEERRLCYVAMTRAMEQLYLTCAGERRRFGARSFQSPSRFLGEVPEKLVEVLSDRHGRSRASRHSSAPSDDIADTSSLDYSYSQDANEDGQVVQPGVSVQHPVFGSGVILAVIGTGLSQKLKIRFKRVGVKTVMVRYANLELG